MTDNEKPFVYVRRGWNISITPRNARGWWLSLAWMAMFGLLTGVLIWLDPESQSKARSAAIIVGYVLATMIWAVAMIFWMKARSDVINVDELLELKREQDQARGRGRTGRP